jgi:hypothetical protein
MGALKIGWKGSVNDRRVASFRYRVEAPAEALKARGHSVELFKPANEDQYQVAVFSKAYSEDDRRAAERIASRGGRVVFDICDNHFYNPFELPRYERARAEILEMMSIANQVTCTTEALASIITEETGGRVRPVVIGDATERLRTRRRRARPARSSLNLLWFGSHGSPNAPCGMTDLLLIREELEALASRIPARLVVCSNSAAKFDEHIAPMRLPTAYVEWSEEAHAKVLTHADAVLIPVTRNPFTDCKSHNRLTSAIRSGLPAIATGIQSYLEFEPYCSLDDWSEGLAALVDNYDGETARAMASRTYIEKVWSMSALTPRWEEALDLSKVDAHKARRIQRRARKAEPEIFQGRLDAIAAGNLTGWARNPMHPDQPVEVVLECDGEIVANALANLPRPDLGLVGLVSSDCGFSIPLGPLKATDRQRLRVLVSGCDFLVGENPILIDPASGSAPGLVAPPAAPWPSPDLFAERGQAVRLPVEAAIAAQEHLQRNLEAVEALTRDLRRLLARSVIATADSPEMADRLSAAIGLVAPPLRADEP